MPKKSTDAWQRFDGHGSGRLENSEVKTLLQQARAGADYMHARAPRYFLAHTDAIITVRRLEDIARARRIDVPEWRLGNGA